MNLKVNITICLLLFACSFAYAQLDQYTYQRELKGITEQWHKLTLPDEVFSNVSPRLSDLRIFGITQNNDTIEAPYILQITADEISGAEIDFKILNVSRNGFGSFITLEVPANEIINRIALDFKQQNFDWNVTLEGSQDQQEWFTVAEDYRILSIKNELTNYQFTKVTFPDARYRFFRVFIPGNEKPELIAAKVSLLERTSGNFNNYDVTTLTTSENKQSRQTEIEVALKLPVPVSQVRINIKDTFDFYRPIALTWLADSIKIDRGWKHSYSTLYTGTLSSVEENEFKFDSKVIQKLKILIDNYNNRPLKVESVEVSGYVHELVVRFTEPARYFLVYGNTMTEKPHYDIELFADKVPANLTALDVGDEHQIAKRELSVTSPLFKNKAWLWAIMAVIILLLGGFTVKMLKQG